MAKQVIVKTAIMLDDQDRLMILETIGPEVKKIFQNIVNQIDAGLVNDVGLEAHDAAAWTSILNHVGTGRYNTLEDIIGAVNCLDTGARDVWWPVVNKIREDAARNG